MACFTAIQYQNYLIMCVTVYTTKSRHMLNEDRKVQENDYDDYKIHDLSFP